MCVGRRRRRRRRKPYAGQVICTQFRCLHEQNPEQVRHAVLSCASPGQDPHRPQHSVLKPTAAVLPLATLQYQEQGKHERLALEDNDQGVPPVSQEIISERGHTESDQEDAFASPGRSPGLGAWLAGSVRGRAKVQGSPDSIVFLAPLHTTTVSSATGEGDCWDGRA